MEDPKDIVRRIGLKNRVIKPDPHITVKVYKSDVKIAFVDMFQKRRKQHVARGEIRGFSWKSGRTLKFLLRNAEIDWKAFLTLTYPAEFPCDGRKTKRDIDLFCASLRRKEIKYAWVMEFQKRTAVHYHFLVSGRIDKDYLSRRWYNIVGSYDEKHLWAGTQVKGIHSQDGLCGYMSGYLNKLTQKQIPTEFQSMGRFWGTSRGLLSFKHFRLKGSPDGDIRKIVEPLVDWYKKKLKKWAIEWEWSGYGFTAIGAAPFWDKILGIEQITKIVKLWQEEDAQNPQPILPGGFPQQTPEEEAKELAEEEQLLLEIENEKDEE